MGLLYLDASAVVKCYVTEPGSTWTRAIVADPHNVLLCSAISLAEVSAAIAVCVRTGKMSPRQGTMAYDEFNNDVEQRVYQLWQVTQPVIEEAAELAQRHPLKGYDAVQVAGALQVARLLPDATLTFVSGDRQALNAAQAEGMGIEDPFEHTDLDLSTEATS